ncbi:MAG: FAD-binding oxidoreductase [Anaerolineales bacterium]
MKRWNGWGNVATTYFVPESAMVYLRGVLGELSALPDATQEDILPSVPKSRLPAHPLVDTDARTRLLHARGQSLPDWVALRSGRIPAFPDGVACPASEDQVPDLLAFARQAGACVVPYGGGSSVVGHINPVKSDVPVLTVDMGNLDKLLDLDEASRVATFEAGVTGPALEARLVERGYTLGHYPQSHEYSTLGGWIAARSCGQQSYYYGRVESLFAGGRVETPAGPLDLPHFPASAAGPDVREMVLGSEGRIGIIVRAQVRVRPRPQAEQFHGVFFSTWEQGMEAVRSIAQQGIPVSMLRLSNSLETETTLILSGKSWIGPADKGLRLIGFGDRRCLLVFGVTGSAAHVRRARGEAVAVCRKWGGLFVGTVVGHTWEKSRFLTPYLRNTLWERGVAVDTLETALPWKNVPTAALEISASIREAMAAQGEQALVIAHLSHVYRDGASVYTTILFRRAQDPEQLLERWQAMKRAASLTIQRNGGTISHQHGVGEDHAPYLPAEKGPLGMQTIRNACAAFDPDGMMNPGKLF